MWQKKRELTNFCWNQKITQKIPQHNKTPSQFLLDFAIIPNQTSVLLLFISWQSKRLKIVQLFFVIITFQSMLFIYNFKFIIF